MLGRPHSCPGGLPLPYLSPRSDDPCSASIIDDGAEEIMDKKAPYNLGSVVPIFFFFLELFQLTDKLFFKVIKKYFM